MSRLPAGLKKVRSDWANPFYGKKAKGASPAPATPEEIAAGNEALERALAHINRPLEPGERGYRGPVDGVGQDRAITKLVDREARVAVEGDTDSNHDNLEGGQ